MPRTSPGMTAECRLAFYPRKIRDSARRGADFVEQFEAVFAQRLILDIHRHLVEKSVDGGPQLRHGAHGGFEILFLHPARGLRLGGVDRLRQRPFLGLAVKLRIGRAGIFARVLLLFDADDVGCALLAGEQVLAVFGVEEFSECIDAADDQEEIVLAFQSEHSID
jgi:hypothetical protein